VFGLRLGRRARKRSAFFAQVALRKWRERFDSWTGRVRIAGAREWRQARVVRDVAYASLGEQQKKTLNAKAGAWSPDGRGRSTVASISKPRQAVRRCRCGRRARRALYQRATDAVRWRRLAPLLQKASRELARALLLDEAWRAHDPVPPIARPRLSAMEDSVSTKQPDSTEGERARLRPRARSGASTSSVVDRSPRESMKIGLIEEEARCHRKARARSAYGGDLEGRTRDPAHILEIAGKTRGIHAAACRRWAESCGRRKRWGSW